MSQPKSSVEISEAFSESELAEYLRRHPDFFERHGSVLLSLKLPHQAGGATISLVERQIAKLRQRNSELERQLKDLVAVAKVNSSLVEKIHKLSVSLMRRTCLTDKFRQIEESLREDFAADRAALLFFNSEDFAEFSDDGFVRGIDRDDPALAPFSSFLRAAKPRCGLLRERQRELAFGREAEHLLSAAMVPLGERAELGFIVIGNKDRDHFHPGKRMDFLDRLGEMITAAIESERTVSDRS